MRLSDQIAGFGDMTAPLRTKIDNSIFVDVMRFLTPEEQQPVHASQAAARLLAHIGNVKQIRA